MSSATAPADAGSTGVGMAVARGAGLTGDLRIQIFGALFGLGTIHHELQFILEQQRAGGFQGYMERVGQVKPTVGWSSEVGIALHLLDLVVGVLLVILPWRRALLVPLAVSFTLINLVSPERTPSHNSLMVAALVLIALLSAAEVAERGLRRPGVPSTDWSGWTLSGLKSLCALTYAFAAFHKLNLAFLSPETSTAPPFLLLFVEPLGVPREVALSLFGYPTIVGTLLIEALLPVLLLARRTRLAGCLLGVLFHLAMMARGILDFPTAILGFYPLFMGDAEARELLARCRARPSLVRLACTAAVAGVGITTFLWSAYVRDVYARSFAGDPLVIAAHGAFSYATIVLFAHVAATLGAWLLAQRNRSSFGSRTSSVARPAPGS